MNIGLNLIGYTPGGMGGVETYFRNLLKYLQEFDKYNSYVLLYDDKSFGCFHVSNSSFKSKLFKNKRGSLGRFIRSSLKKTIKIDLHMLRIDGLGLDIIHHPFSMISHLGLKTPAVLTFHDMQHEFYPNFFSQHELLNRQRNYKLSAETAKRVIAISGYSKKSLIERYNLPGDKIDVVYPGCGMEFHVIDDPEDLKRIKGIYNLTRPFIYYPAATWPHKNHKRLLMAIKILRNDHKFDGNLVLTGIAKQSHNDILSEVEKLGLNEIVRILGYLPYSHLPYIYNLAGLLIFPSLFEGFGIPIVEAMACGCPVVCSNITSIPEVAGNACEMFNPLDPEDIAVKLWSVWIDKDKRTQMRLSGLERVKEFNWKNSVNNTLAVYSKTFSSN